MRIETIEQKIYSVQDVKANQELQERVLTKWRESNWEGGNYHWCKEIHDSYNAFNDSLPFMHESGIGNIRGLRLRTWLINNVLPILERKKTIYACKVEGGKLLKNCVGMNSIKRISNLIKEVSCPFTGMGFDHDFLEPILNFIESGFRNNHHTTYEDLIDVDHILRNVLEKEQEWQDSDEYILDCIEANEYEFNEDGTIY